MEQHSATDLAEIATYTDTGKTIVHRGITYAILNPPADEKRAESPYILRSPRGKYYALMRNNTNRHALFGVGLYGSLKCLPGWFTDKNGSLVSTS
jgi:hypothetical protein